jgi:hypothetical protein
MMEVLLSEANLINQGNQPGLHGRAFLMEAFEWQKNG